MAIFQGYADALSVHLVSSFGSILGEIQPIVGTVVDIETLSALVIPEQTIAAKISAEIED